MFAPVLSSESQRPAPIGSVTAENTTGEDNSVSTLKEVKAYCEEKGIAVIEGAASNTSEVQEAAQNLAAKCDAVFSPNDNTIAGAMGTVTEVMARKR